MKKILLALSAVIIAGTVLAGCEQKKTVSLSLAAEDYPVVDGSTATIPLAVNLRAAVTGEDAEELKLSTAHTKTDYAFYTLMNGDADLLLVYTPADSVIEEIEGQGFEYIMEPIGKDALVFITNKENSVEELSTSQIQDIYQGKIKNWNEVGGSDSEIFAYQRNPTSGSQVMMEKLVMKDKPLSEPITEFTMGAMGDLIEAVVGYGEGSGALGYSVYYYVKNFFDENENMKLVSVDSVKPSNETIEDGSYPFCEDFYVVIRKDEPKDSNTYKLYEFLKSDEGKTLISDSGYVAIK